jgi:hypothetical protein
LQQDLASLGQALQSGNLASAQQAYSTFQSALQQAFPNFSAASGSSTGSGTVNVSA